WPFGLLSLVGQRGEKTRVQQRTQGGSAYASGHPAKKVPSCEQQFFLLNWIHWWKAPGLKFKAQDKHQIQSSKNHRSRVMFMAHGTENEQELMGFAVKRAGFR